VKHCSWKLYTKQTRITDNWARVDELLVTQWAHFRLTVATLLHIEMTAAARGGVLAGVQQIKNWFMIIGLISKWFITGKMVHDGPVLRAKDQKHIERSFGLHGAR